MLSKRHDGTLGVVVNVATHGWCLETGEPLVWGNLQGGK